jgi:hypothetical protein
MLFRKNVIEKSFMNWRVLPLIKKKINTLISHTPEYIYFFTKLGIFNV